MMNSKEDSNLGIYPQPQMLFGWLWDSSSLSAQPTVLHKVVAGENRRQGGTGALE